MEMRETHPARDRRSGERRSGGDRRAEYRGGFTPLTFLMSLCGALVVLYLFFVAVGGVDPTAHEGWTIAALILAVLWLAYSWRRLWRGGASPSEDRERRGF